MNATQRLLTTALLASTTLGCYGGGAGGEGDPEAPDPAVLEAPAFSGELEVTDALGQPLLGAEVQFADSREAVDALGRLGVETNQPVLAIVEAPGKIPEPVVLGRDGDPITRVRLLDAVGPTGTDRLVMHFAGDVMLGRRYVDPTQERTAKVELGDGGVSARAVVSSIAPLFRAADIRSLNLETVVGNLPLSAAFPEKRFLLQSPPEALEMLDELGVSVVTLGNNHIRDWLEAGVASTVSLLDSAGIPYAGGGLTQVDAERAAVIEAKGVKVGFLSYTTVNGDFVNDSLPSASEPVPSDLDPSEVWQYEERAFGFRNPGDPGHIPTDSRRIGPFWNVLEDAETQLDETGKADLWREAAGTYPELQDWVARRGHGGAAYLQDAIVAQAIADLRAQGVDLVCVQVHAGFQFAEVKSRTIERTAHRAIDAGADLVVCHHPHVLQGLELYKDKLIAYSLGNFIFDQDFLATFPSVVLRTVFEGDQLIEARLYPVVIESYRPVPVSGASARDVLDLVHERSARAARADRIDGAVRAVSAPLDPDATPLHLERQAGTGLVVAGPAPTSTVVVTASTTAPAALPAGGLWEAGPAVELGRDLYRFGSFEDDMADGLSRGSMHWELNATFKREEVLPDDAPSGIRGLRLRRHATNGGQVFARPVARVTPVANRLFTSGGAPLDGAARYSVRLRARRVGDVGEALVRVDLFNFDDTDPTVDPGSTRLRRLEIPIEVPSDGAWHDVEVELPGSAFQPLGALEINASLFYVGLTPPAEGTSVLLCDDVMFVEWRRLDVMPAASLHVGDLVRPLSAGPAAAVTLTRHGR